MVDAKLAGQFAELAYEDLSQESTVFMPDGSEWQVAARPANDAYTVFRSADSPQFVFAFKGTTTILELADDLIRSGQGFITPAVQDALATLADLRRQFGDYNVAAVGHSLGGAQAQTFALKALAQPNPALVRTFYFDSLPISLTELDHTIIPGLRTIGATVETRIDGVVQRRPVNSRADAIAYYHAEGGVSQGIYYGGEIATTRYSTVGRELYLDSPSSFVRIPNNTNGLALAGAIGGRLLLGPIGILIGFLGVTANAHRMALLNETLKRPAIHTTPDGLIDGANLTHVPIPANAVAPILPTSVASDGKSAQLSNGGRIAVNADGTVTMTTPGDISDTASSHLMADGTYSTTITETQANSTGNLRTFVVAEAGDPTVDLSEDLTVNGLPVHLAYRVTIDSNGNVSISRSASGDLGTNLAQAKNILDGQGLDAASKALRLAVYEEALAGEDAKLASYLANADPSFISPNDNVISAFLETNVGAGSGPATTSAPTTFSMQFQGDRKPINFGTDQAPVYHYDALGNIVTDPNQLEVRDDSLFADSGGDSIDGGAGNNSISGGAGADLLTASNGDDTIAGKAGDDYIRGGGGHDFLWGDDSNNPFAVTGGNDVIEGGGGTSVLAGEGGADKLYADGAVDLSTYSSLLGFGGEQGSGGRGAWLAGGTGDDLLVGGAGNDVLYGGTGNNIIIGGAGDDAVFADQDATPTSTAWTVRNLSDAGDPFAYLDPANHWPGKQRAIDTLATFSAPDAANPGANIVYAGAGNDFVAGGIGNDVIYGELGNDILYGDRGDDYLSGGAGDDWIQGGDGNDIADGGAGNDVLVGNAAGVTVLPHELVKTLRHSSSLFLQGHGVGGARRVADKYDIFHCHEQLSGMIAGIANGASAFLKLPHAARVSDEMNRTNANV